MGAGNAPASPFLIRRLAAADAESYRDLRLIGLRNCPEAFGASYEHEASQPLAWFADRLENNIVLGGWSDGGTLAGIAALHIQQAGKSSHKARLWGMFVAPRARRTGLATALLEQRSRRRRGDFVGGRKRQRRGCAALRKGGFHGLWA